LSDHPTAAAASTLAGVPALPPFSVRQVVPWLLVAGLLLLIGGYLVSVEQGATSVLAGSTVHEWVHDARHLLGFPCH